MFITTYLLLYYAATTRELFPLALVNGNAPSEGRLLVLINGTFGTVCDDYFGFEEAQVACRQLNYASAVGVASFGEFGAGEDSEPIYLDDVTCTGSESYLHECDYSTSHNCYHFEDVGIVCTSKQPVEFPFILIKIQLQMLSLLVRMGNFV